MGRRSAAFLAAAFLAAAAAEAGEVRGPVLGNNGWRGEVRDEGAPDVDDFVGPLLPGERLSASVRAAPGSALLPGLRLLDPSGAERAPALRASRDGRAASFRGFAADRAGRWAVRVEGREESEGAYLVRFRVGRPRGGRTARLRPGGSGPRTEEVPFGAIRGAALSLRARCPGSPPRLLGVLDPSGREVPGAPLEGEVRGGALRLRGLPLDGPDGTWRLLLGLDGEGGHLAIRVDPPPRPRGTGDLLPFEPRIDAAAGPAAALGGGVVRLRGSGFAEAPLPAAFAGGRAAEVLSVGPGGVYLDMILPQEPPGTVAEAAVVNPDGQACGAPAALLWLSPGPPAALGFRPGSIALGAGESADLVLTLTGLAPPGGVEVALSVEGGVGTVPPSATVPAHRSEVPFRFEAGPSGGEGRIVATLGVSVAMDVRVSPPPPPREFDLSGWTLVQTDSARTFTFPEGTLLRDGGSAIVARDCTRAAFEAFWGALPGGVLFLATGDAFPSINGGETFALLEPGGAAADGPTPVLVAGQGYLRTSAGAAGSPSSWTPLAAAPGSVAPGSPSPTGAAGAFLLQYSDAAGTGNFVYEFVEVRWEE